ncbi:MAG: hypothetical protein HZC40_12885 [Chloroflexi bacterium]|nr:hypothetical protein [Chloroflexota bacterium]
MIFKSISFLTLALIAIGVSACGSPTAPVATTAPIPPTQVPPIAQPTLPPATAIPTVTFTPTLTRVPPTATTTPTRTLTPTPNPKTTLLNTLNAAIPSVKTYRVRVVEEGRFIGVVLPDRFQELENDFLMKIGPTLYRYDFAGTLQTFNMATPFFDRTNLLWWRDRLNQVTQVTTLPPTTIDKVPCVGFATNFVVTQIIPPKTPGPTPQTTQINQPVKVWLASDGLPRRVEMGAPTPLTINFMDYNEAFEINPP